MFRREPQRRGWKFRCGPVLAVSSVIALALVGQGAGVWPSLAQAVWPALARGPALPQFAEYAGGGAQAFSPFNATLARSVAPQVACALALLVLAARLAAALTRGGAWRRARADEGTQAESGASVVEFALVLPLLLTILLLVFQIALLVQAKFVVNYAAFCAARSAVVTIPAKIYSTHTGRYEKSNTLQLNSPVSPKMNIIRRAAALPVTAISPALAPRVWLTTGASPIDSSFLVPLGQVMLLFPFYADGKYVSGELLTRASYAYDRQNTSVEVIREGSQQRRGFGDHELVTVRVTYRYYLTVPIASRLLGTPYRGGILGFITGTGWYYPLTEQYTLPVEGEPLFPPDQEPRDRREVEQEIYE